MNHKVSLVLLIIVAIVFVVHFLYDKVFSRIKVRVISIEDVEKETAVIVVDDKKFIREDIATDIIAKSNVQFVKMLIDTNKLSIVSGNEKEFEVLFDELEKLYKSE